jgi:hypothetical protein
MRNGAPKAAVKWKRKKRLQRDPDFIGFRNNRSALPRGKIIPLQANADRPVNPRRDQNAEARPQRQQPAAVDLQLADMRPDHWKNHDNNLATERHPIKF